MESLNAHRSFYASLITASAGVPEGPVRSAFAHTPREDFVGEGPWKIVTALGRIETPSADPTFIYQDILIALTAEGPINNGQPSLHALCLSALQVREGETVLHVGAGTGYYTAILSKLAGARGSVFAYELEPEIGERAVKNLAAYPNVTVYIRSGSLPPLPECDILYVNAGATAPLDIWLDALVPGGRLLFPLTPAEGFGGMLLLTRTAGKSFKARFLTRVMFIPCMGARDDETARRLGEAFKKEDFTDVRSLHRDSTPDKTCWFAGDNWWLSSRD